VLPGATTAEGKQIVSLMANLRQAYEDIQRLFDGIFNGRDRGAVMAAVGQFPKVELLLATTFNRLLKINTIQRGLSDLGDYIKELARFKANVKAELKHLANATRLSQDFLERPTEKYFKDLDAELHTAERSSAGEYLPSLPTFLQQNFKWLESAVV
jgi:hypothetical protein